MFGLSPTEIGVVAFVVILLFGTKKLPELGEGLGKAINNFKSSFDSAGKEQSKKDSEQLDKKD